MSSKYPILPPKDIIKVLLKYGFFKVSQKGSHAKYKNYNYFLIYFIKNIKNG